MSSIFEGVSLSNTQTEVIDEKNLQRLENIVRNKCGEACGLVVEISPAEQTACASCNNCHTPAAPKFAINEIPKMANALILDTDLVKDVNPVISLDLLRMVRAVHVPEAHEKRGVVMLGQAATLIDPTGYACLENDFRNRMLFPVSVIEGQGGAIYPGMPLLIERPE